ncbi:hypothetical protein MIT9_P1780 [Methylomarinovum caldicuralii]|uniref:cyclic-guanylate-specific phosphodiesterase n=1 Tax=Methylomarinovum caldicuralii TaxID=438856 RepID=A0AAU9C0K2_9GAMM|nr:EAL domain-containing protein [Methylomarinovum caldicuralii]BCX82195.1 hypothetical protein MIT9_P1780 [Methylomarinovum caldicuralii]
MNLDAKGLRALYDTLAAVNRALVRVTDERTLLTGLCRAVVERAGFRLAWVGRVEGGRITPDFRAAAEEAVLGYLDDLTIPLDPDLPAGRGPVATAAREGRAVVVNDCQASPIMAPWKRQAARYGLGAVASFPLYREGQVVAVLAVYAGKAGYFTEDLIEMLEDLACGISYALNHFAAERRRAAAEKKLEESEARYRQLFKGCGLAKLLVDPETATIVAANPKAYAFYHYPEKALVGRSLAIIDPEGAGRLPEIHRRVQDQGWTVRYARHRLGNGQIREVEIHHGLSGVADKPLLYKVVLDVSFQRCMARFIHLLAVETADKIGSDFFTTTVHLLGEELQVAYALVSRLDEGGKTATALAFYDRGRMEENFHYPLAGSPCEGASGPIYLRSGVKERYPTAAKWGVEGYAGVPLRGAGGRILGYLVVADTAPLQLEREEVLPLLELYALRAAAELRRIESAREIERLAFYDPLTGLPNRRFFCEQAARMLAAAARQQGWGALLFLDLDNFKVLNDARGHEAGDRLLIQVAGRLRSQLRQEDLVARLGGDEFVILLPALGGDETTAAQHAEAVAEKILDSLAVEFQAGGYTYRTSASIGVTLFAGEKSLEELLKQADAAMYRAKAAGRNAIRFYHPEMQRSVDARLELEKALRRALEQGDLELHYQPQHCAAGRLAGAEALLRWPHSQRDFVPPNAFIPVAEESGLILPLGRWVLETACRQISRWHREGLLAGIDHIAVNISPRQFHQPGFVAEVEAVLAASGAPPQKLMLELTEGILIEDVTDTIAKMEALRKAGVRFSIDDFGTGYSSLLYLKRLPLDELKIDRSFVSDLETDSNDRAIVETILAMARHLKLAVVAEGVETEFQRDFLQRHGCRFYQGWFYGKPLPAAEFRAHLRRRLSA